MSNLSRRGIALVVIVLLLACDDPRGVDESDTDVVFEVTPEPVAVITPEAPIAPPPELTLESWAERLGSDEFCRLAVYEVREFGAAAIPVLRRTLEDPRPVIRGCALHALTVLGPVAAEVAGDLEAHLDDERDSNRAHAIVALGAMGKSKRILELAPKVLEDPSTLVRARTLTVVQAAGPGPDLVKKIESLLESEPSAEVRAALVNLTGRVEPGGETVCRALRDPDPRVRDRAIPYCTGPGTASWRALFPLVGDPVQRIAAAARVTLIRLGSPEDRAAHLAILLASPDQECREPAARALGGLAESTALIERTLGDEDVSIRQAVLEGLASFWTTGGVEVETIRALLGDPSEDVRAAAAEVYSFSFVPPDGRTLARVLELLESSRPEIELRILTALPRFGSLGEAITAALVRRLGVADVELRARAAEALGGGESRHGAALVPALLRVLRLETEASVRVWIVLALGKCGSAEVDVLRVLTSALAKDEDWSTRCAAAMALGRLGPSARRTRETLKAAAERDSHPTVRLYSAFALWQVTGDRDVVETVIIECLNTAAKGDGHRSGLLSQAAQLAARCDLRTARYREALERALASDGCRLYPEAKEALLERLR